MKQSGIIAYIAIMVSLMVIIIGVTIVAIASIDTEETNNKPQIAIDADNKYQFKDKPNIELEKEIQNGCLTVYTMKDKATKKEYIVVLAEAEADCNPSVSVDIIERGEKQ